ncbi:MAG: hypothetical protein QME61_02115, partial [Patescibacteria group bacterium]|nr:hypothetical protein [Patescibacteria group bacterium]
MKSPERPKFREKPRETFEEERNIEKLRNFSEKTAERLREEVPVDNDCRIDMEAFRGIYSSENIEGNKQRIKEFEMKIFPGLTPEEIKKEKLKKKGEQLEILTNLIFNKLLGPEFICVRTSLYDDWRNKVDELILEKETGNVVCAFDEVGDIMGPRFEAKKQKILEKNIKGGAEIKYGLGMENGKLVLKSQENIPIFYLALLEKAIEKGVREFIPSFEEKSDYEKRIFNYFILT